MELPFENALSIRDFAASRQQDNDTVTTWIRRHPEVDACCKVQGKDKYINVDSEGFKLLEKQYPLPRPIEVIEDKESRAALIKAQHVIIQLQEQIKQQAVEIAEQKSVQLLLEDRTAQLNEQKALYQEEREAHQQALSQADQREKEARERAEQERIRAEEAEKKLAEAEQKAAEAEAQVASMKQAGFFARLFKKGW